MRISMLLKRLHSVVLNSRQSKLNSLGSQLKMLIFKYSKFNI